MTQLLRCRNYANLSCNQLLCDIKNLSSNISFAFAHTITIVPYCLNIGGQLLINVNMDFKLPNTD